MTGCILSYTQLLDLLTGLSYEGRSSQFRSRDVASKYHSKRFQRRYRDLLTSLVLFGNAKLAVPAYVSEQIEAETLVRENLLELSAFDANESLRCRLFNTYDLLYEKCRSVEQDNPVTSNLRYIDDPVKGRASYRIDAVTDLEDINFYLERIYDVITTVTRGIKDIFGYYFLDLQQEFTRFYESSSKGLSREGFKDFEFGTTWTPGSPEEDDRSGVTFDIAGLLRDMGICIRDGATLANRSDGALGGFHYSPSLMGTMPVIDEMYLRSFEVESIMKSGSSPYTKDLFPYLTDIYGGPSFAKTLGVHIFWQVVFSVINMIKFSEESHSALFIPSNARIGVRRNQLKAGTSQELLRVYRIFLSESGLLPTPVVFDDVLRLREDKNLRSLRAALNCWVKYYQQGSDEPMFINSMRQEIIAAEKSVRRLETFARTGSIVGYIALPIGLAETLTGKFLGGVILSPIGPAIDTYRTLRLRKFGWIKFGR